MNNGIYIIAEVGVNHNGSLEMAKKLVTQAVEAGANAVKFQTFKAEKLASKTAQKANYQKETTGKQESQFEMLKKLELSHDDHYELLKFSEALGIEFLSTPFDQDSLKFLTEDLGLKTIKISSGDITNLPLLYQAARFGCDIILSSGISTLGHIEEALGAIALGYTDQESSPSLISMHKAYCSRKGQEAIKSKVTLLHCTTEYPTEYKDVHLNKMQTIKQAFSLRTGFSDHTLGAEVAIAAVALGAEVVEKHFTLDKGMEGPDHRASIEPHELKEMVTKIRNVEQSLGQFVKIPASTEFKNIDAARKSVVAVTQIQKGEIFTVDNLTIKRPGSGMPPSSYWGLLGKSASQSYEQDDLINE